jgi:signal transduction histidine kinase
MRAADRQHHQNGEKVDLQTVLIISDDPELARTIMARWQSESNVPAFTVMKGDLCQKLDADSFEVAIVGAVRPSVLASVLKALEALTKPVLFIWDGGQSVEIVKASQLRVMILRQHEGWLDALVLVVSEALRHCEALARAIRAEEANVLLKRQATLGRYILEMRHSLNNALTSVLGNSELLLLEPETLSAGARSQIETVRNMALRMHEILQRFSSLEKELTVIERQTEKANTAKALKAAATK